MSRNGADTRISNMRRRLRYAGLGAVLLVVFSLFQKVLVNELYIAAQPRAYVVPILYGAATGWLIGEWHNRLKQSQRELADAYDATLDGWARAVEMRDRSTEHHTRRVVALAEKLARLLRVPEKDVLHLRRGALLHDIGKLAVPDSILNKPGPLTEEEMAVMRKHPQHAYEVLAHIHFLKGALDIPYCHHERWDGSGYPRQLKGEEIPLAARLFSIIDVWDALSSDRPYRKQLPHSEVVRYLREKSGHLFDPRLVDVFLAIMESQ
jgi:putative nucleotidyltransferase with HDIG domain